MDKNKRSIENESAENYDLTEEGSKRPGGEEATTEARKAENDDIAGTPISNPNDDAAENRISTSLSDE